MPVRRLRRPKVKGGKKVSYTLIEKHTQVGQAMYARLTAVREDPAHQEIQQARIALAWCTSWKPNVDGLVILGKCKKATELDRELAPYDFVILLNQAWWYDVKTTDEFRDAVIDHELCHAAPQLDPRTLEQVRDERNRPVWRTRKHDVEEFIGVIQRRGVYRRNLELAYAAARRHALGGFVSCGECSQDGWRQVEGGKAQRCQCFLAWQARVDGVQAPAAMAAAS